MAGDHHRQFIKIFNTIDYSKQNWEKFFDFCEMSALSLRLPFKPDIEKLKLVYGKYKRADILKFDQMFELMVGALESGYQDFLGTIFQELELSNKWKGQFFTPYHVCKMMAKVNLGDISQYLNKEGYFTCSDPACGAGATLIAVIDEIREQKQNPSSCVFMVAQDVDLLACYMCYIQLSLCGVAAKIVHGNSLSMEIWNEWLTPVYYLNNWPAKIALHDFREFRSTVKTESKGLHPDPEPTVTIQPGNGWLFPDMAKAV